MLTQSVLGFSTRRDSVGTFYNPATLVNDRTATDPAKLAIVHDRKLILGLGISTLNTRYNGSSTFSSPVPLLPTATSAIGSATSHTTVYIPSVNWSVRLSQRFIAGFKVGEPYNATISYPADSSTRYAGYATNALVVSAGPEFAYQLNNKLSLGFGAEMRKLWFGFSSAVPLPNGGGQTTDATFTTNLSDWAGAWSTGLFYRPRAGTALGLTFYSQSTFHLTGISELNGQSRVLGPVNVQRNASTTVTLPWSLRLNGFQALSAKFGINALVEFVKWSELQQMLLQNTAVGTYVQPFNYRDTWQYALGGRYQASEKWIWLAGAAYQQSPVSVYLLRPIVPLKSYISVGGAIECDFTADDSFTFSYHHSFIGASAVNYQGGFVSALGAVNASANLVELTLALTK